MKRSDIDASENMDKELPGYPAYPASDDIYSKGEKIQNINPDDNTPIKETSQKDDRWNEKAPSTLLTGDDLDIPDMEMIEKDEEIGEEDEENSYYSIGGDEHNNLDEFEADII
jgi:hypothetical protein